MFTQQVAKPRCDTGGSGCRTSDTRPIIPNWFHLEAGGGKKVIVTKWSGIVACNVHFQQESVS